jgi:hypothetical protein
MAIERCEPCSEIGCVRRHHCRDAALINASFQLGAALGLALFVSSLFLVAAALIALRATNTRGEPVSNVEPEFVLEMDPVPAIEGV